MKKVAFVTNGLNSLSKQIQNYKEYDTMGEKHTYLVVKHHETVHLQYLTQASYSFDVIRKVSSHNINTYCLENIPKNS
jgi:hypothetical protein